MVRYKEIKARLSKRRNERVSIACGRLCLPDRVCVFAFRGRLCQRSDDGHNEKAGGFKAARANVRFSQKV